MKLNSILPAKRKPFRVIETEWLIAYQHQPIAHGRIPALPLTFGW